MTAKDITAAKSAVTKYEKAGKNAALDGKKGLGAYGDAGYCVPSSRHRNNGYCMRLVRGGPGERDFWTICGFCYNINLGCICID